MYLKYVNYSLENLLRLNEIDLKILLYILNLSSTTSHYLVPDPANTKTIETTAETIELKGLKAATTYKVKVAALNGAGAGPLSSPIEELVDTHIK